MLLKFPREKRELCAFCFNRKEDALTRKKNKLMSSIKKKINPMTLGTQMEMCC